MKLHLGQEFQHLKPHFDSIETAYTMPGVRVSVGARLEVYRVVIEGIAYYIKRYRRKRTGWRKFLVTARIQQEWINSKRFTRWGIPTAPLVAWGLERLPSMIFSRGVMITEEIPNVEDLASIAKAQDGRIQDRAWFTYISKQVANATRQLHQHHFAHNDLKWRNLLIDPQNQVFFIDCPKGGIWFGPFLTHRIIKDLACLDKLGKKHLTQTQRLRFYKTYAQCDRLNEKHKKQILKVLNFFRDKT